MPKALRPSVLDAAWIVPCCSIDFMSLSEEDVNMFKGYEIGVNSEKCDVPLAPVTRTKEPLRMKDMAQ